MGSVPAGIAQFADTYLASLDDLQVLISCVEDADRWCDAATIADRLGIPYTSARTSLDQLARKNLLDMRITGDLRYRFRPGTPDLETKVRAFVEAYRKRPSQVVRLIEKDQGQRPEDKKGAGFRKPAPSARRRGYKGRMWGCDRP